MWRCAPRKALSSRLYLLVPVLLLVLAAETDKTDGLPDKLMMRR